MRPGRRPAAAAVAGAAVAPLVGAAIIGVVAAVASPLFPSPAVAQRAAGARQTAAAQPSQDAPHVSVGPNLRLVAGEHNEAWIAASGTNSDFLVAVAQTGGGVVRSTRRETVTLLSRDGGRLWAPVALPGYTTGAFDPMVAAGPGGRIYVMHAILADFSADAPRAPPPPIRVWSTTDEGRHWDGPTELRTPVPPDHPRMVVDMSGGAHHGRLYLVWNDVADMFLRARYELFLQYSDDGGKTFSEPALVNSQEGGKLVATDPVVLSDGTLLVTYYQYFNPLADRRNDAQPFFVKRSTDGGATFGATDTVFTFGPSVWRPRQGDLPLAFAVPIVLADTSSASRYRDHVYIAWDDVGSGYSDIWLVRSTDRGRTWSKPLRVNDNEAGAATGVADFRMTPTPAVAPDGRLGIAWYDRRNDPVRQCWELFFTFSDDGGRSFQANRPISNAKSCPPPDQAPGVYVHNLSPYVDPNRVPDSLVERMSIMERTAIRSAEAVRAAREEAFQGVPNGRLRVTYDPGRNVWPGHYSGLAADGRGTFHALWLDRRSGQQELFTARIEIGAAPPPASLVEADVTDRIEIRAGAPRLDRETGAVVIPVQARNVSDAPVWGPVELRIVDIARTAAGVTATLENA